MAGTFPRFKLFDSTGVSLVYEFDNVLNWGDSPFLDPTSYIEHTGLRGQGSIITAGSIEAWDFELEFYLSADDYEALVALMQAVSSTIVFNTKYILKIDLTEAGSTKNLKVKRLEPVRFPITTQRKVVKSQRGFITFRVDSWK